MSNEDRPPVDVDHNWRVLATMAAWLWKHSWSKKKEVKYGGSIT